MTGHALTIEQVIAVAHHVLLIVRPGAVRVVRAAEHGAVSVRPDGTLAYTPMSTYSGPDSFTYAVADTQGYESAPCHGNPHRHCRAPSLDHESQGWWRRDGLVGSADAGADGRPAARLCSAVREIELSIGTVSPDLTQPRTRMAVGPQANFISKNRACSVRPHAGSAPQTSNTTTLYDPVLLRTFAATGSEKAFAIRGTSCARYTTSVSSTVASSSTA